MLPALGPGNLTAAAAITLGCKANQIVRVEPWGLWSGSDKQGRVDFLSEPRAGMLSQSPAHRMWVITRHPAAGTWALCSRAEKRLWVKPASFHNP